jgi:hypothetical protein
MWNCSIYRGKETMKVGDRAYCITRKEFGIIDELKCDPSGINVHVYFVSFADGVGFWFYRGELTEAD